MAIIFTNDRHFHTDTSSKIWDNILTGSHFFKIKILSASPPLIPNETTFLGKATWDYWHKFMPSAAGTTVTTRLTCMNAAGSFTQVDVPLTIGVVYQVAITWNGTTGNQTAWISGVPLRLAPAFTGNTFHSTYPLQIGPSLTNTHIVFALDDHNVWDNYVLTSADVASLLSGANPTTIGGSATWRARWTLAGTTSANAAIGDAGLKNAYGGGGSQASGGDGSDFLTVAGAGSAVYTPTLIWVPTVEPTPTYVDTCGKVAVVFFKSLVNGSPTSPSQIVTIPTLNKNGISQGALGTPWFTGYHSFAWFPFPSGVTCTPSDAMTLSAPTAWANTPAGAVEAMDNLVIENRTGKSIVRADDFQATLPIGVNNPQNPMTLWGFYMPFANWRYRTNGWPPGNRGKYTSNATVPVYSNEIPNGIDGTFYPGPAGLWCIMWDAGSPGTPTQFTLGTDKPATTTVTERVDLRLFPPSGIGMCRVFDVEHVSLTGNANLSIQLIVNDPSGVPNYSNLWIVGPGDFNIVSGAVVLDRSDPLALSRVYTSRVPSNVGSLRWEDSTIGGNPQSYPYPETLKSLTDENWGDLSFTEAHIGFSRVGPIDTAATPYIYSPFLGRVGANGETFTATLTDTISTTPAVGTHETWHFSDGATAPLFAGLEIKVDSEIVRVLAGSGTAWSVYRGSNGTTPATHAAGPVTVYGRRAITGVLRADGSYPGALVFQTTTAVPHGITTGSTVLYGGSYATLTFSNGNTLSLVNFSRPVYVTGPNTFFIAVGSSAGTGVLTSTTTLNPSTQFWDRRWPEGASLPHEACAVATGKFPNANLHVNIWPDACDDLVYEIARRVLAHFPPGLKAYIEYTNEPWNQQFGGYYFHTALMGPLVVPPGSGDILAHYVFRAVQVHTIFRTVFAAAGRGSEIVGILNCQQGQTDAQSHLNYAIAQGWTIDAIAIAPYVSTEATTYNVNYFNANLDDEQGISMFVHDLWYNPRTYNAYVAADKAYIQAYNQATGKSCILIGYEGGVEFAPPVLSDTNYTKARNRDMTLNPNWYIAEQDFYAWLQVKGFDHLHVYALAMFWAPAAWGIYHGITQDHGRGDGTDGKFDNRLCRALSTAPHYKGPNVNQDLNTVSVRGQAFIDWLGSIGGGGGGAATSYTFDGPITGMINLPAYFTITLNGTFTGTVTVTPSGGGLTTPYSHTWTGDAARWVFPVTPVLAGVVTLTATNNGGLTNPSPQSFTVTVSPAFKFVLGKRVIKNVLYAIPR